MTDPGRKPPRDVLRALRREVGFCCPVEGCGSPYLTWHHFDPPWRDEKHHRPEGMIALCWEHAHKADNGSFTDDQLRHLKRVGAARATEVRGRFDWMRNNLLAHVGGNFYYENLVILTFGSTNSIWFERDEDNQLLLNMKMPTLSGQLRARIENNVWSVFPQAADEVICPPSGRLVEVAYRNGDRFRVEYQTATTREDFLDNYPRPPEEVLDELVFPLTIVNAYETLAGSAVQVTPTSIELGGWSVTGQWFVRNIYGVFIDVSPELEARLFAPYEADNDLSH